MIQSLGLRVKGLGSRIKGCSHIRVAATSLGSRDHPRDARRSGYKGILGPPPAVVESLGLRTAYILGLGGNYIGHRDYCHPLHPKP